MADFEKSKDKIATLVKNFKNNHSQYISQYNEAQARQHLIDPFFIALEWDVRNEAQRPLSQCEVIIEQSIATEGPRKAPDYIFRFGFGTHDKFFVEAKKPGVDIKESPEPAYQLRRYLWSAEVPVSILTDFEEFSVYERKSKPSLRDRSSKDRPIYHSYEEYVDKWIDIWDIFSHDAVKSGSLGRFAKLEKRGTEEVGSAFLDEIEGWRESLAKNIAIHNSKLDVHSLNFAVQRTIDRIIFLRICEDRAIEPYGRLQTIAEKENIYKRLINYFVEADQRYNSGLFHFKQEKGRTEPDELTPKLNVDDKVLKEIIDNLYYPDCPYEFSVMPGEILGNVYEQFLGKVIRLTESHHAKVEEKPEVRKAGGVYYTPRYIVDYIVENTVGKLCKGKTPKEISKLKILDPACGSGSFLLGAYTYLRKYHLEYYAKDTKKHKNRLYQSANGEWFLTTKEKKQILLDNIYGVDIDPQAVEVTKLSLLLKVLEGENQETVAKQLQLFKERALPDLGNNIKCGNSLISPDYLSQQKGLFEQDDIRRINAFDWNYEFPEIMKNGGFDCVIGNPPYVRIQSLPQEEVYYLTRHYLSAKGNCDLYVSFIEKGFNLLKPQGKLGEILPNKFFRTDYGEGLRELLSKNKAITEVVDFGANQVFSATTYTCLIFLTKIQNNTFRFSEAQANSTSLQNINLIIKAADTLGKDPWLFTSDEATSIIKKLSVNTKRLLDLPADISRGSSSGCDEVYIIESDASYIESKILRTPIFATDFNRYYFSPSGKYKILFPYVNESSTYRLYTETELSKRFPKAYKYLYSHQDVLKKRKQYSEWFSYSAPRNLELHDNAQIIIPLLAKRGSYTLIPKRVHGKICPMASGGFTITISKKCSLKPEYVIALLNSRLLFWKLKQISNIFRGGWITCTKQYFGELPIYAAEMSNKIDRKFYDQIIQLVERISQLHEQLSNLRSKADQELYQRQISATDRQIDQLVYELYGLTKDEIKVVEGKG